MTREELIQDIRQATLDSDSRTIGRLARHGVDVGILSAEHGSALETLGENFYNNSTAVELEKSYRDVVLGYIDSVVA